jgi:hypothetical protein
VTDPRQRLQVQVVRRVLGVRTGLAEAADAADHQAWVARMQHGGRDAQALEHPWTEALHQNVTLGRQREQGLAASLRLEVQHHALLAAVHQLEERWHPARRLAAWRLHLDDRRSQRGQQHGGVGAREVLREVEDPHVVERACEGVGVRHAALCIRRSPRNKLPRPGLGPATVGAGARGRW